MNPIIQGWRGTVIVSCQARPGDPFNAPEYIAEFAKSALMAGSSGLRINEGANIRAVKEQVPLPVIGIRKRRVDPYPVYITPALRDVREIIEAGTDIVALDGTGRERPEGASLKDLIAYCHSLGVPVMADIATVADAEYACGHGADLLATTLSGYTEDTQDRTLPDFERLREVVRVSPVPVLMEGGIHEPDHVTEALRSGAYAVVVGKAITMPHLIARRYVEKAAQFATRSDSWGGNGS